MELLKQPLNHPLSMAEQVITLVCANGKVFSDLATDQVKNFQKELLKEFAQNHNDIISKLNSTKALDDDIKEAIIDAALEFKNRAW